MIFLCDGVRYESHDLVIYATPAAGMPLVCATRDHARVFLVELNRWSGVAVRELDRLESEALAAHLGLDDLTRKLATAATPTAA
jgi:hypothetical protein